LKAGKVVMVGAQIHTMVQQM